MEKEYCPKCDKEIKIFLNIFSSTSLQSKFLCNECSVFIIIVKEIDNSIIYSRNIQFKDSDLNYYSISKVKNNYYSLILLKNNYIEIDDKNIITDKDAWKYLERYIENGLFI